MRFVPPPRTVCVNLRAMDLADATNNESAEIVSSQDIAVSVERHVAPVRQTAATRIRESADAAAPNLPTEPRLRVVRQKLEQ